MAKAKTITVAETVGYIGSTASVSGWVHTIRDMGKIAFIEIRDHTGLLQVVVDDPAKIAEIGSEYVVTVEGEIRERGERFINPKLITGTVEMGLDALRLLNPSAEPPFEIKKDTSAVHEELRLQYRYLDIRSERMASNLRLRHQVIKFMRDFLDAKGFIEIETPMLTKGTPEGAREFLVPSRQHPEQFYVLPQSPQQFKQLLMVGGVGRYFQIARCMRDEDQRGDRQPEFTQLDVEMAFVNQDDIMALNERLMIELVRALAPEKKVIEPFPKLTYGEAMERYNSDKPDLRKNPEDNGELAFCWVVDFPMFEQDSATGKLNAVHHPFTAPKASDVDLIEADPRKANANAYDLVLNGYEIGGGSIRINQAELQTKIFELLGLDAGEIKNRFGHMLEAFSYGTPPHGGIALGIDRLIMILAGEPNIREVIAFPKTGDARDPLMGSPTAINSTRLAEVHIRTVAPASQEKGR